MQLEAKKYLLDIQASASLIGSFVASGDFDSYASNAMLRSAVERQFGIIGEALRRLEEIALEIAAAIPEYRRIIAFRNVLMHGYAVVDSRLVWGVVEGKLPDLAARVNALLSA